MGCSTIHNKKNALNSTTPEACVGPDFQNFPWVVPNSQPPPHSARALATSTRGRFQVAGLGRLRLCERARAWRHTQHPQGALAVRIKEESRRRSEWPAIKKRHPAEPLPRLYKHTVRCRCAALALTTKKLRSQTNRPLNFNWTIQGHSDDSRGFMSMLQPTPLVRGSTCMPIALTLQDSKVLNILSFLRP